MRLAVLSSRSKGWLSWLRSYKLACLLTFSVPLGNFLIHLEGAHKSEFFSVVLVFLMNEIS